MRWSSVSWANVRSAHEGVAVALGETVGVAVGDADGPGLEAVPHAVRGTVVSRQRRNAQNCSNIRNPIGRTPLGTLKRRSE